MTTLHVPIGIPASGKSTLAAQLRLKHDYLVVVSSDELREALGLSPDSNEVWQSFHFAIAASLGAGLDVFADATNLSYRHDYSYAGADRTVAHVLQTPFDKCFIRNSVRERKVPYVVMRKMQDQMDQLILTDLIRVEGFDQVLIHSPEGTKEFALL